MQFILQTAVEFVPEIYQKVQVTGLRNQDLIHLLPTNVWHGKQLAPSSLNKNRWEKKVSMKSHHQCGQLRKSQFCPLNLFNF